MTINLGFIKKSFKRFWYIFVAEFICLGFASILYLKLSNIVEHKHSCTLVIQSNGSNSNSDYIYSNVRDLVETKEFKKSLCSYYNINLKNEYSKQALSVDKRETSIFLVVTSISEQESVAKEISKKASKFLIYLSTDEGISKYSFASFFKVSKLDSKISDENYQRVPKYTFINYAGAVFFSLSITALTGVGFVIANKKTYEINS